MEQFDKVSAVFEPKIRATLKPKCKSWIGKRMNWQAAWIVETGAYKGQWAMSHLPNVEDKEHFFGWVPEEDLVEIEALKEE